MKISIITATYNRPQILVANALSSIKNQSDHNFELVIVNDGADPKTKNIIRHFQKNVDFPVHYIEMEHPPESSGFGLCYGRNLGLENANGNIVTYLDDDNSITPDFIASVRQYFQEQPLVRYSMARQNRRRDIWNNNEILYFGKPFISPSSNCSLLQLLAQQEIFDSNGFAHYRKDAPRWNPQFRVFADYEYLLQAAGVWGNNAFGLNQSILVNYVQSSTGIIGSSNYEQWAEELSKIVNNAGNYTILDNPINKILERSINHCQNKAKILSVPEAFAVSTS